MSAQQPPPPAGGFGGPPSSAPPPQGPPQGQPPQEQPPHQSSYAPYPQLGTYGTQQPPSPPPAGYGPPPYPQPYPPQQGPYAAPAPYGPIPHGGGYGPPPMVPPPRRTNRVAVVIGAVALTLGLVFAAAIGNGLGDTTSSSASSVPDAPAWDLRLPEKAVGGEYTLTKDMGEMFERKYEQGFGSEQPATINAGYYTSVSSGKLLLYAGVEVKEPNPDYPEKDMLNGVESRADTEVAVPRRTFTPSGGGQDVTCEVLTKDVRGRTVTVPVCTWVNHYTQAMVVDNSPTTWVTDPSEFDLKAFAELVARFRDDVRTPTGGEAESA